MDVPTNDEGRALCQNKFAYRRTAATGSAAVDIETPLRWRMRDEHRARREVPEEFGRLLLAEVVAPGPERCHRDTAAKAEELNAVDRHAGAVQDVYLVPSATGGLKFFE